MLGRRTRRCALIAGAWMLAGCSADSPGTADGSGGAGGAPVASLASVEATAASPEARAVVERVRAMRFAAIKRPSGLPSHDAPEPPREVLAKAAATRIDREGGRLVARVPEIPAGSTARRADVSLGATMRDGFRLEDRATRMAIEVRPLGANPRDHRADAEIVAGYVVYRGEDGRSGDVIHRVTAEGTEDFVAFERAPAKEELAYELTLSDAVAGLRLVGNTLELVDGAGTPRLRMAPPYVASADGTRHDARVSLDGCAYESEPGGRTAGNVTPPGAERCVVHVRWSDGGVRYPAVVDPAWTTTGSMATARTWHTASLLLDGKVLVAAGYVASAELYDPVAKTWSATGSLPTSRGQHTASVLLDGKVLVAGGTDVAPLANAELYDPTLKTWTSVGSLATARYGHTASALANGKVLVAGGNAAGTALASAELYDPVAKTWSAAVSLSQPRFWHTANVLSGGKVLVVGGYYGTPIPELYDPVANTWAAAGTFVTGRYYHSASVLSDGKVLVAGGFGPATNTYVASAELYDPLVNTWSPVGSLETERFEHTASLLSDGKVLVVGGSNASGLASAEQYDPVAKTWSSAGSLETARAAHTASVLVDGKVLVTGGGLATAELFARTASGPCTEDIECLSGFCIDGFCCNTACASACDVCAAWLGAPADGTCGPASLAYAGTPFCGAYACDGAGVLCPTSCASDLGCGADYYCAANGTCLPRAISGVACDLAPGADCKIAGCRKCGSGTCADGFCCSTACAGSCDVCAEALGASADGTCTKFVNGHAPQASPACGYQCDGINAACPSTCSADTDCALGFYCNAASKCLPQKAKGATCDLAAGADCGLFGCRACATGRCVDGVCCDKTCSGGSCDACAQALGAIADGTCTVLAKGLPPSGLPACPGYLCDGGSAACPSSCAGDGDCNAASYCATDSTCKPKKVQGAACNPIPGGDCLLEGCGVCGTGNCVEGFCCDTPCGGACDVCSQALGAAATGTCGPALSTAGGSPSCGTYLCDGAGSSCPVSCASDAQCASNAFCRLADQTCQPAQPKGAACTVAKECASGFCADGVCCDTSCDGLCQACTQALKGFGQDGACGNAGPGKDPHDDCPDDGAASCSFDGACNGGGGCRLYSPGSVCGAGQCSGNTAKAKVCDGFGTCSPEPNGAACAPYACVAGACPTTCATAADCSDGNYCDGMTCKPTLADGVACMDASGCTSGICADGVCCNDACNGQCEACDGATPGKCAPVSGEPHLGHTACAGTGTTCGGTCDGVNAAACSYAGGTTSCGKACADGNSTVDVCDGLGACKPGLPSACDPYVCDGATTCKQACASDSDCVNGFGCAADAKCIPVAAKCADDDTLTTSDGKTTECAPYRCSGTACKSQCTSVDDCVSPNICDAESKQCVAPKATGSGDAAEGCGCRVAGRAEGGGAGVVFAVALAAVRRRRRLPCRTSGVVA